MKLILLLILLCSITSTPNHKAGAKKISTVHQKTSSTIDIIPAGLLLEL